MQSDQHWYRKREMLHLPNQGADNRSKIPVTAGCTSNLSPGTKNLGPFNSVEFQPSNVCPRNFIIFNHTDNRSRIMFHPTMVNKFTGPAANTYTEYIQEKFAIKEENDDGREKLSMNEDSDDINALLSSEEEETEEYDEEEVSTGNSHWTEERMSLRYCSGYLNPNKMAPSSPRSSTRRSCNGDTRGERVKKMVKALRGIVPGGDQMNTVDVLDEAVKYLKSLKMEVQKLSVARARNV